MLTIMAGWLKTHMASVRLFSCVPPHVDQKHVLCFERSLVSHTSLPVADKLPLAVLVDVI